jgi:hypothetical protein
MPTGLQIDPNNTDITNHYLGLGVAGGVLLMFLFIALLVKGFGAVGIGVRNSPSPAGKFAAWAAGAALFAQAATGISVSYFDQSIVFLYVTLAAAYAARCPVEMLVDPLKRLPGSMKRWHHITGGRPVAAGGRGRRLAMRRRRRLAQGGFQ